MLNPPFCVVFVYNSSMFLFNSTIRFVPCAFFIDKQFHTCAKAFPNEFTVRSYEYCAGKHWILYWIQENKTATYLRMILWKISTAISTCSIKHRILATFNIKKINSDSLYAFMMTPQMRMLWKIISKNDNMTIPIIKPDNVIHYIQYIYQNLRKSFVSSLKNTTLYTCQKLTKHFQPELCDDSGIGKNSFFS